jgi:hypothetical protein
MSERESGGDSSQSFCTACGSTGRSSTGRQRRLPRSAHKEITGFPRHAGKDVPPRTVAVVRPSDAWRAPERVTALSTLIRQRHLTPSCGGRAPTAERTVGPARIVGGSLTPRPGIREQHRSKAVFETRVSDFRLCPDSERICDASDVRLIPKGRVVITFTSISFCIDPRSGEQRMPQTRVAGSTMPR